jgi:hypothetical protein
MMVFPEQELTPRTPSHANPQTPSSTAAMTAHQDVSFSTRVDVRRHTTDAAIGTHWETHLGSHPPSQDGAFNKGMAPPRHLREI